MMFNPLSPKQMTDIDIRYSVMTSSNAAIHSVEPYTRHRFVTGLRCVRGVSLPEQEMFKFVQETVKAEAWLKAKEPLIATRIPEAGETLAQTDEVEQLILRHEAFRKAAVTWKERFSSLRQLSAVSLTVD